MLEFLLKALFCIIELAFEDYFLPLLLLRNELHCGLLLSLIKTLEVALRRLWMDYRLFLQVVRQFLGFFQLVVTVFNFQLLFLQQGRSFRGGERVFFVANIFSDWLSKLEAEFVDFVCFLEHGV